MTFPRLTLPVVVGLALSLPAALAAQVPDAGAPATDPTLQADPLAPPADPAADSVAELVAEFDGIQAHLAQLQDQVLQEDTILTAHRQRVGDLIQLTVETTNPGLKARADSLSELESQFEAANAAGDNERASALMQQGFQIQMALDAARSEATKHPDVVPAVDEYKLLVIEQMKKIDPDIDEALARLDELALLLSAGAP